MAHLIRHVERTWEEERNASPKRMYNRHVSGMKQPMLVLTF